MPIPSRSVLIIGASRGIGLGLAREWLKRGWQVVATVRGAQRTELHEIADAAGEGLQVMQLEMTEEDAVRRVRDGLSGCRFDLLFVNAGVANGPGDRVDRISTDEFTRVMITNALSPLRVVEELGPLVRSEGTIAVMSSSLGSVALNDRGGWEVYRASKAALNTLMRSFVARHAGESRSFVLMDPGWVRTDMGGSGATLGIEESVPGILDALAALAGKPGLRYVNYRCETVPW